MCVSDKESGEVVMKESLSLSHFEYYCYEAICLIEEKMREKMLNEPLKSFEHVQFHEAFFEVDSDTIKFIVDCEIETRLPPSFHQSYLKLSDALSKLVMYSEGSIRLL